MGHVGESVKTFDYFATYEVPRRPTFYHWLSIVLSACQTGLVFGVVKILSDYFNELRYFIIESFGVGWGTLGALAALSLPLLMIACSLLVHVEPVAGGSGITDVFASLNGLVIPRLFRPVTYLCRILGFWVAMSSGLWVGPEGPMIYVGAAASHIVGSIICKCVSARALSAKEDYDTICSGAAMGASAAFRAPLAGTVMLMEGFGLLWHHSLVWQTFVGCFIAVVVSGTFSSKFTCSFVLCSSQPGDFVMTGFWTDGLSVIAIICSSVTLGLLNAAFSWATFGIANCWGSHHNKSFAGILLLLPTSLLTFVVFTAIGLVGNHAGMALVIGPHDDAIRFVLFAKYIPLWLLMVVPLAVYMQLVFLHFTPLVAGIFLPAIFCGACIGRFYADMLGSGSPVVVAVCGAASGLVGYFRYPLTVSVLIAEVTSNMFLSIPVMASVIVSKAIADLLSPSIMSIMVSSKGYHLLSHIQNKTVASLRGQRVGDYAKSAACITEGFDLHRLSTALDSNVDQDYFPIVSVESTVLRGLTRDVAEAAVAAGHLPRTYDKPFVVDERMDVVTCYRLMRSNGIKDIVIVSHYNKVLIGVLDREVLSSAFSNIQ